MLHKCASVVCLILVFVFLAVMPAAAAYCTTPNVVANVCPSFALTDRLTAMFGGDTVAASQYCSAECRPLWDARDERSLRWEMERWVRANHTTGMFPEAYQFVVDELMRLTNELRGDDDALRMRPEFDVYAARANATLRVMPWLLAGNETVRAAQRHYHDNVQRRHIVRAMHLAEGPNSPAAIRAFLQDVASWWAETKKNVAQDPRAAAPLLPWITLEQFIGPPATPTDMPAAAEGHHSAHAIRRPAPMQRRSFRFHPLQLSLPTAVVYYYAGDCVACEVLGAAFDILPLVYRRLCEYGHRSIVSCSPLFLFIRASMAQSGFRVPAITFHGFQRNSMPYVPAVASFVFDLDEMLNPNDVFDFTLLSVGAHANIAEILVAVLRRMVALGIVQPRYLSPDEVAELNQLVYDNIKQKERKKRLQQQQQREGKESESEHENSTNTTRVTALDEKEEVPEEEEEKKDMAWRHGRVVTLENHLRDVVMFHMRELWGNSTAEMENRGRLSWLQVEPPWIGIVSALLSVVWVFILLCPRNTSLDI